MSDMNEQPEIARVLGIEYDEPISDASAWAKVFADPAMAPAAPTKQMFHGPLGDMATLIAPHVAWDPTAFVAQSLVAVGNWLGYRHFVAEEATQRHPNLFLAVVGGTASGKGTSWRWAEWVMRGLDDAYVNERITTAVGSGEGLLAKITDPVVTLNSKGEETVAIDGSPDKRVLYLEEELGQLFSKMMSQDSLEKMVTKGWDSGRLETTTKKEAMHCENPHVSIIGHITPDELTSRLEARLIDNGFSNRWLYLVIKPTQVKFDSPTPDEINGLTEVRDEMIDGLKRFSVSGGDEFVFTPDAKDAYLETARYLYDHPHSGAMVKQDARARPLLFKLAMIYAAIDGSNKIEVDHFLAARSLWAYCSRSARAFFGTKSGNENVDRFMELWRWNGFADMTLSDVSDLFSRNMNASKRNQMLDVLARDGVLRVEKGVAESGRAPMNVIYNAVNQPTHPTTQW